MRVQLKVGLGKEGQTPGGNGSHRFRRCPCRERGLTPCPESHFQLHPRRARLLTSQGAGTINHLMIRKILLACFVLSAMSGWVEAQQGGGQNPPTPSPQPAPAPTQPRPTIPTAPAPSTSNEVFRVSGRIIMDTGRLPDQMIEVRFETDGGQPVGYAYTTSGGEFSFQDATGIGRGQDLYAVVKVDGFKPYRERLDMTSLGGLLTIFLEREASKGQQTTRGGTPVVDLKQLRAKIPGKAVDEYEKALKELSKGNYPKVIARLELAAKLAPDFYEAQNSLGVQYFRLQKFQDAEKAFVRARDLNPNAAEPLINLGSLYYQEGEIQSDAGRKEEAAVTFQKAVQFLKESIRRNPLSPSAHNYLGAALYKTASYEPAESMLHRALELDQELHEARLMLINVYTKQNRLNEALEQINTFLAKNPKSPQRPALEGIKVQIEKARSNQ